MSRCIYCKREAGLFRKVHPECKEQHFGSASEVALLNPKDLEGHQAVLKKGVEVWNAWRKRNPKLRPDLRGAALVHAKLSGADLSGVDLEAAQLTGADLRETDLEGARLHKAVLRRAQLVGAYLEQADLSEADLSSADLRQARMSVSNLHDAQLVKARLGGASLVGSTLRNADLSGADLEGCKVRGSDVRGASFHQAALHQAQFQQSDLSGVRMSEADLSEADLSGTILAGSDLVAAKMESASLRWSNLDRANLREAVLSRADCREARFYRTNLQRADLQGADLSDAFLIEANLDRAVLEGCRVARLMMRGTSAPVGAELLLSDPGQPPIRVGSIEAAQFIQTLAAHPGMRNLLLSARSRLVPVIGCFSGDSRAGIGSSLVQAIEDRGLVPVIIDWPPGHDSSLPDLVPALMEAAACIIVDWSRAEGLADALEALLTQASSVPVQPLQMRSEAGQALDSDRFLELIRYDNSEQLLECLRSSPLEKPVLSR